MVLYAPSDISYLQVEERLLGMERNRQKWKEERLNREKASADSKVDADEGKRDDDCTGELKGSSLTIISSDDP
jgi:hypothetical protein